MHHSYCIMFLSDEFLPKTTARVDYQMRYKFVPTEFLNQPEHDSKAEFGKVRINIHYSLMSEWRLAEGTEDLHKILFEYAKRLVMQKAREDSLENEAILEMANYNYPKICPFNPENIEIDFNVPIII